MLVCSKVVQVASVVPVEASAVDLEAVEAASEVVVASNVEASKEASEVVVASKEEEEEEATEEVVDLNLTVQATLRIRSLISLHQVETAAPSSMSVM